MASASKPIGLWLTIFASIVLSVCNAFSAEVSITMDDPSLESGLPFSANEKNTRILEALRKHDAQAVLFVCGKRVDSPAGMSLIKAWQKEGHWLGNHTYSHENFNSNEQSFEIFSADAAKGEKVVQGLAGFHKVFRFPFLKEGDSSEKRDQMRAFLVKNGYSQGYVTIDASDWYISDRLRQRLKGNPKADLRPYRDFYLKHIWDRAQFYNGLSKKVLGREVKHTLLIHHNMLNALFLDDLLSMFESKGWKVIAAKDAFQDPVFRSNPKTAPAGESILWALAKETGKYDQTLRYPGESDAYEKDEMDRLGL